jgi:protein O-mannosyl-transferase
VIHRAKLKNWLPFLLLWAVVVLAYSNIYGNNFLYDDEFLIQKNELILTWSGVWKSFFTSSTGGSGGVDSFYRPMQGALYTVVYQISGFSTTGFHLLNLLLHLLNVTMIVLLAKRLGFSKWAGWMAAFLWAVHPIHTEAVTYQSATADPLYTFFMLIGLFVFAGGVSVGALCLSSALFLLGLCSKETAIVFPALAFTILFFQSRNRWNPKTYLPTLPFWILAGGYLLCRMTILNFDNTFHFYKVSNIYTDNILYRFYTCLATLPDYFGLLLWPTNLHIDRNFPVFTNPFFWQPLLGGLFLVSAIMVLWVERRRVRPIFSFAVLWFVAADVPHTGVLLPVNSFFLEHWMYLPSIGIFLVFSELVLGRSPSRVRWRVVGAATAVAVVGLAIATFRQNEVWATPITFYTNILKYEPKVSRVHNNLAMAYSETGQEDKAIEHYKIAIAISDVYPQTHHNLARAMMQKNDMPGAVKELQTALRIDPNFWQSALLLSQMYEAAGAKDLAKSYRERTADIQRRLGISVSLPSSSGDHGAGSTVDERAKAGH